MERKAEIRREKIEDLLQSYPQMEITPLSTKFVDEILRAGLIICGGRQTGKSNMAKLICSQIINGGGRDVQVKVSDTCQNWVHEFSPIYYQHITEQTRFPEDIYFGDKHFLYDVELENVEAIQHILSEMCFVDYGFQREFKKEGLMDTFILWTIEEAQNVLGTYALNGREGKRWLKLISESGNFNMNYIFIGQRLADISTKAVERCESYLFTKMTGDNDLKKIRRICGKDIGVHEVVPTLERGECVFWNGAEAKHVVRIPKYQTGTRPILWGGGMGVD